MLVKDTVGVEAVLSRAASLSAACTPPCSAPTLRGAVGVACGGAERGGVGRFSPALGRWKVGCGGGEGPALTPVFPPCCRSSISGCTSAAVLLRSPPSLGCTAPWVPASSTFPGPCPSAAAAPLKRPGPYSWRLAPELPAPVPAVTATAPVPAPAPALPPPAELPADPHASAAEAGDRMWCRLCWGNVRGCSCCCCCSCW